MRLGLPPIAAMSFLLLSTRPAQGGLSDSDSSDLEVILILGIGLILTSLVLYLVFRAFRGQSGRNAPRSRVVANSKPNSFSNQAVASGFLQTETRLLNQIANKVPADMSSDLLDSDSGRAYLISDLEKRISRRQREIELIRRIRTKLEKMGESGLTPRATVRIETDIRIWIAKKIQHDPSNEEKEDVFVDIEPVIGRLQDISEGGARLVTNLDVDRGDMIELWSADADIILPPVTSVVIDSKPSETDLKDVLHLHFMDPPLGELRSVLYSLQSREASRSN